MFIGALFVLAYFSYVFITERFSLLPPARFHFAKHNGPRTRKRYLGYWSALSIIASGIGSAVSLTNTALHNLLFATWTSYSILMLPGVGLYWLLGAGAGSKAAEPPRHIERNRRVKVLLSKKIRIDHEL